MSIEPTAEALAADPRVGEILDIFAKETNVPREKLTPEATLASLDVASLDMVQAIFALETKFDIEIPVAENQGNGEFETVGDLLRHVLKTIDGAAPVAQ